MKKKVWSKCPNCDGYGVHYYSIEKRNRVGARDCSHCKGKRGWLVDPKFVEVRQ